MELLLPCECGHQTPVREIQAGMQLMCKCGRMFAVPSLTELRRMSGREATLSPGLLIDTMVANGELPATSDCAACGADTAGSVDVLAICERARAANNDDLASRMVLVFLLGWIGLLISRARQRAEDDNRLIGTDRDVRMPLRICPDCQALRLRQFPSWPFFLLAALIAAGGIAAGFYAESAPAAIAGCVAGAALAIVGPFWAKRRFRNNIRRLLSDEPVYRRLLDRFPDAQFLIVGRERAISGPP